MIITKRFIIDGSQPYSMTAGDAIVVKVKSGEEFRYRIPDNWHGDVTITIKGELSEILPT